jgi:hypothetical protein
MSIKNATNKGFDANRAMKAVKWPAIVWVVSLILFKIAALVNLGTDRSFPIYAIATTLGLVLGLWAGREVKALKGDFVEAILAGIVVGLACGIPALLFDLGSVRFLINITIFSLAAAWAGWGLK